jgi:hypothetical protein
VSSKQRETLTWTATIVQTLTVPGLRDQHGHARVSRAGSPPSRFHQARQGARSGPGRSALSARRRERHAVFLVLDLLRDADLHAAITEESDDACLPRRLIARDSELLVPASPGP